MRYVLLERSQTMRTLGPNANGYYDVSDQMIDDLRRRAETHFRRQGSRKSRIDIDSGF